MARELTQREIASMGGKALAEKYGKRQRQEWGKRGGRPRNLDSKALADLQKMLRAGLPKGEIAQGLDISTRTLSRYLKRREEKDQ